MPVVPLDGQSIFGLAWTFKRLPSKDRAAYDNLGHLPVYFGDHRVVTEGDKG